MRGHSPSMSMATHVGDGAVTYSSIQVYYIDDRRDLLDYVGPKIGVRGNTKLVGWLGRQVGWEVGRLVKR